MSRPFVASTWLVAGTPTWAPYPCRCWLGRRCNPKYCTCSGRRDHLDLMPAHCCARRESPPLPDPEET